MKFLTKNKIILIILFLASIIRLWKLGTVPPSLTPDEASLGYNAYSILKTGRDEYGTLLPIIFKSFGDWKPGLYVYATVPSIALFGLNEFAVRLPSALAGTTAVFLLYKIVAILFAKQKNQLLTTDHQLLASVSAALLAISPWHIHFSRGAWEINLSLTLTLAGIYAFLKYLEGRQKYIIFSAIFFGLTLITYQGAKLSSLVVLGVLAIIYWKKLYTLSRSEPVSIIGGLLVGILIITPVMLSVFQGKTGRLEVFSIFSYPRSEEYVQSLLDQGEESYDGLSRLVYHSEGFNFGRAILGRWFNHISGRFLFYEGDWPNPRHSAPNHGILLLWEFILLPIGFYAVVRKKVTKGKMFILLWLILAPLPSILSRDEVHAVRAYNLVIPLAVVSSFGLYYLMSNIKKLRKPLIRTTSYLLLSLMFITSVMYFLDAYFIHLPIHNSKYWEYGQKQVVETILPLQESYGEINIQQSFAQPYIYYLFYSQYDPASYQKQANLVESEYKFDVGYVERIDNVRFRAIDWPINRQEKGKIFVADNIRIPPEELEKDGISLLKEIKFLDGNTAYYIVEMN